MDITDRIMREFFPIISSHKSLANLWTRVIPQYPLSGSHGLEHVYFVCHQARLICLKENLTKSDLVACVAASGLHDVGRFLKNSNVGHAVEGWKYLKSLVDENEPMDHKHQEILKTTLEAVRKHCVSSECTHNVDKVLWDADKLDLLSFSGLIRMGMRSGELRGTRIWGSKHAEPLINELRRKVRDLHPSRFFFAYSQKIAANGWNVIKAAYDELTKTIESIDQL